jgi:hypothetical protein
VLTLFVVPTMFVLVRRRLDRRHPDEAARGAAVAHGPAAD